MSNQIHPTAIIDASVKMGNNNIIGPYCNIGEGVEIGKNNQLIGNVTIDSKVKIGNNNFIYNYASIGTPGEMGPKGDRKRIKGITKIGNNNTIRENVSVNAPVYFDATTIGNNNYLMNGCYVAHDAQIGNQVNLTAGVKLAGRVKIEDHVNIGLNATVHQRICIGESAMIGMNAVITRNIIPFSVIIGSPSRILKFNEVGAKRRGLSDEEIENLKLYFENNFSNRSIEESNYFKKVSLFIADNDNVLMQFVGKIKQ